MGIDKFHSWLKNTYYNSILDYNTDKYDHIYVDLNFVLHRIVSYVSSEKELYEKALGAITTIITNNTPAKSLTLAADGSATYAKIILQKKRRMQTAQTLTSKQINDDVIDDKINSLYLTPGTEFMNKFNNLIREYTSTTLQSLLPHKIKINLDLSDEPDESEFKICRYLKKNTESIYDTHLVISNDADIVLIAMAQLDIYNINVVIQLTQGNTYIISIDLLIEQHMEMFGYNLLKRFDFVFVSLLNGNDYFPKLKYSNFDKLWKSYGNAIRPNETIMQKDGSFDMKLMVNFLIALMRITPKQFNNVQLRDICDYNINDYLVGIRWCMSLYSTGNYASYDYIYSGKSMHPTSIVLYIQLNEINKIDLVKTPCEKIPSELYTILVLPSSAKYLIPKKYHELLETDLKYIYDEEHCKKCAKFRDHFDCADEDCAYTMKEYMKHKKIHIIKDPKKYIDDIVAKIKQI